MPPARLVGPTGHVLELEALGYEFPRIDPRDPRPDDFDPNWLLLRMTASDGQYHWFAVQPNFLTWEIGRLAKWLRAVADGTAETDNDFDSMESQLRFERTGTGNAVRLEAHFNYGVRPPELEERDVYNPYVVTFTPGAEGLRRFADGLEELLRQFPVRVMQQDGPAQRWLQENR